MPIALTLTISGRVGPDVKTVLVNGVAAVLTGTRYSVEVPVEAGVVTMTSFDAAGNFTNRTLQVIPVTSASA